MQDKEIMSYQSDDVFVIADFSHVSNFTEYSVSLSQELHKLMWYGRKSVG